MTVQASEVVSFDSEELILVDEEDNAIGTLGKARCHDGDGVLHRAFSVFLFDADGSLLLQRRSASKRLWPLYWSNSCCSHPRSGESMRDATVRRVRQELGVDVELEFVYKFIYHVAFADQGSEREFCSVFLGRLHGPVLPNGNEVAEVRYATAAELSAVLASAADSYTPWFKMEWQRLNEEFADRLARYTGAAQAPRG